MSPHLDVQTVFTFITGDFEGAWAALAQFPNADPPQGTRSRGNFLFACQSVIFLEWICRLCKTDPARKAIDDFSRELHKIQSLYFTELPGPCVRTSEFDLPTVGQNGDRQLLPVLFDLIRNGQTHQYQQIPVILTDGKFFIISLTGVEDRFTLHAAAGQLVPAHLSYKVHPEGLVLTVHPGRLYLDFKSAFLAADLLSPSRGLTIKNLVRGGRVANFYQFDSNELEQAFAATHHPRQV